VHTFCERDYKQCANVHVFQLPTKTENSANISPESDILQSWRCNTGCLKKTLQWYSKRYCVASVTKTFTVFEFSTADVTEYYTFRFVDIIIWSVTAMFRKNMLPLSSEYIKSNVTVKGVAHLLRVREVPGPNLRASQLAMTASFGISSSKFRSAIVRFEAAKAWLLICQLDKSWIN
jgi:hypothetical protein